MLRRLLDARGWNAALAWALCATLSLRIGLGAMMAAVWLVARQHIPLSNPFYLKTFGGIPLPASIPGEILLSVWPRWDAVHHLSLAMRGYQNVSMGDSVFYPMYALLTHILATLTRTNYIFAGLTISTFAAFGAFACLYRVADTIYGPETARWSVAALATYPTAIFLLAPFTESLFLAMTMAGFIAAYGRKWLVAGLLGCLASLTRGPGMLSIVPLGIIAIQQWFAAGDERTMSRALSMTAGLGLTVAGGISFLAWRSAVGFPPVGEILQEYSGLVLVNPVTGLISALDQWLRVRDFSTTFDVLSTGLFLGICLLLAVRPRWRRFDWLAYMVVNMLMFLSKQSFTASSLQSMSRYVLTLFPAFIVIGDWLARQGPRARHVYIAASSAGLLIISALYTLYVFVG